MGHSWTLKGRARTSLLGSVLLLFDFKDSFEVEMVLLRGLRKYKDKVSHLDRWILEVECF